MNTPLRIAFALYDSFSALEFAALYEPLARQGFDCQVCAQVTEIYDASGLRVTPTCVTPSLAGFDWVVVPGGPGALPRLERPALLTWLATAVEARRLIATGEGVLLLAAAGLAHGKQAAARADLQARLEKIGLRHASSGVCFDGILATAAGPADALELAQILSQGEPVHNVLPVTGKTPEAGSLPAAEETPKTRSAVIQRRTGETQVEVRLDVDGVGRHQIDTGLPFLDHMLAQVAVHGLLDLYIQARGDLHIDPHHTMEDVALTFGSALQQALGDRSGIVRMASADCPMDESLAWVAVDFSGRPYCIFQAEWHGPSVGSLPVSLIAHFFESLAINARCNLHAAVRYGRDDHHQAEALFKALGRALCAATRIDHRRAGNVPSSKGILF